MAWALWQIAVCCTCARVCIANSHHTTILEVGVGVEVLLAREARDQIMFESLCILLLCVCTSSIGSLISMARISIYVHVRSSVCRLV